MLSPAEVLKMLVGLKEVNDLDVINDDAVLAASCTESDKATVRSMAAIIEEVYDSFDYEASPEFLAKLEGKSEQVQTMHRKLLDQTKRRDAVRRLGEAITQLLSSNDAFNLVNIEQHHRLIALKELAESIGRV